MRYSAGAGLHVLMNIVGSGALNMFPGSTSTSGAVRGIQACAPLMKDPGGGSIVNIGSVAGITGNFSTACSASKWALEGLSRSAACVYTNWGLRCNVIQPGFIETGMTAQINANPLMRAMSSTR